MIDLVQALVRARPLRGPRIAVVGDGGGHGAIACDVATPPGSSCRGSRMRSRPSWPAQLPATAATRNPVDLAGGGEQDFHLLRPACSRTLLESGEVDGVLLTGYFGGYSQYSEEFAELEVDVARDIALAVAETPAGRWSRTRCTRDTPTAVALREGGVPVYPTIEAAAAALAGLRVRPPAVGAPALPPRADRAGSSPATSAAGRCSRPPACRSRRPISGAHARGGAGRRRRARLSGGREGRGRAAQVRRGRRRRRDRRSGRAGRGRPRPDRPAGAGGALGRAHGAAARGRRADRRRPRRTRASGRSRWSASAASTPRCSATWPSTWRRSTPRRPSGCCARCAVRRF